MGTFTPLMHIYSMNTNKQTKEQTMKQTYEQVLKVIYYRFEKIKTELQEREQELDLFIEEGIDDDDKFKTLLHRRGWVASQKSILENLLKYDLDQFDKDYFKK